MDASNVIRQEVRKALHVYMSRTGFGLRTVAEFTGYAYHTLRQFSSSGRISNHDGLGEPMARKLLEFFTANPATLPDLPGKLYESEATRTMDAMLASIRRGRWGTLYGPAGAQKTFLLEYRAAEAARELEPWLVYIRASASGMSPTVLLSRIAQALSVPYAQSVDAVRQSLLYVLRRRKAGMAVALDEAQHLYSRIDTLETLREIGDLAGNRIGILVAGNEQVLDLFEPRRKVHFEQWRSRIQQLEECVLGPARAEARRMILGELPGTGTSQVEAIIDGCEVKDPKTHKAYVNARRLFNTCVTCAICAKLERQRHKFCKSALPAVDNSGQRLTHKGGCTPMKAKIIVTRVPDKSQEVQEVFAAIEDVIHASDACQSDPDQSLRQLVEICDKATAAIKARQPAKPSNEERKDALAPWQKEIIALAEAHLSVANEQDLIPCMLRRTIGLCRIVEDMALNTSESEISLDALAKVMEVVQEDLQVVKWITSGRPLDPRWD